MWDTSFIQKSESNLAINKTTIKEASEIEIRLIHLEIKSRKETLSLERNKN